MLTINGKNYIANKFGLNGCYVPSGMSWTYTSGSTTYNDVGGTAQLVSRLVMTSIVDYVTHLGVIYSYSDLKANNDNNNITLDDALWIAQNDGSPSTEPQFCVCPSLTCILSGCPPLPIFSDTLVSLSLIPTGGFGTYTYSWALDGIAIGGDTQSINLSSLTAGNHNVVGTVEDSCISTKQLCSKTCTITVECKPLICGFAATRQ